MVFDLFLGFVLGMSWRSDNYRSARLCVSSRRRTRITSICSPVVCSHFFYYYFILLLLRLILNKLLTGIISIVDGVCP